MLQNVAVYPNERDVFYRENDDGTYGVEAFFTQYITLEVPFEIVTSLIFAVFTDLAAGLPRTPQMFFVNFFNCFCIVSCGESLGIMVCSPLPPFPSFLVVLDQNFDVNEETVQHPLLPHRLRRKHNLRLPFCRAIHVRCPLHQHAGLPARRQLPLPHPLRHPQPCPLFPSWYILHMQRGPAVT